MPVTVTHLREPPPARHGNVAFFANLEHIFFDNRALTDELRDTVRTLDSYGGRLLPVLGLLWDGPDSLLVLETPPMEGFDSYFRDVLDLRLPRIQLFNPDASITAEIEAAIRAIPNCAIDGFVTDEWLADLSERTSTRLAGSVAGSRCGNNKSLLHHFLDVTGEPVFDTIDADSPSDIPAATAALAARGYQRAVVKSVVGASGIGLVHCETARPPDIPPHHFIDGPCLVQGWIDDTLPGIRRVASPSVQFLVAGDTIHLYDLTDQILSIDSVHEGNISPPESITSPDLRDELLRQSQVAASWLHTQGYQGTGSADFHLAFHDDDTVDVRVCELNARVTGATYPSLLARHFLPRGAWLMRNLLLSEPRRAETVFDKLFQAGLLFTPGATHGVLPINFNPSPDGRVTKGQFLVLGPDHSATRTIMLELLNLDNLHFARD